MTELPDEAIEAFFLGDANEAWEQDEALARLADHVLTGASGPAPRPSPALLAFLGEPDAASAAPRMATPLAATQPWQPRNVAAAPAASDRGTNVVPLFRRLRLTVGIAATAAVAAVVVTVAGTTSVLPEPVMQTVSWVVEAVTPFELRQPARTVTDGDRVPGRGTTTTVRPGPFGSVVGPGPAGQGGPGGAPAATTPVGGPGAPAGQPGSNRPVTPPGSIPAGVPGPAQPSRAGNDGGQSPPAPFVPGPPGGISPPAGGGSAPLSTTPADRARQAQDGGAAPSTVAGPPTRR